MPARDYYLPPRGLIEQPGASIIEPPRIPRSVFKTKKQRLSTFNAGYLVPFLVDEILPGDHMTYDMTAYCRMATPLFPIYSSQRLQSFWFFIPARLCWTHWVNFMGEQVNPTDSIAYTVPVRNTGHRTSANYDDLDDHFGIPNQCAAGDQYTINAMPYRAYNRVWNEWFRDENIESSVTVDMSDGPDTTIYGLLTANKLHDYFTSCLPWPQKFTAPTMPLTDVPILGIGYSAAHTAGPITVNTTEGSAVFANYGSTPANPLYIQMVATTDLPAIYADMSQANFTINAFRQAYMIQTLLERDARGGTRYIELIKSHFGVISPDFRLQRSEYIGGGSTPLMTTPVAQTAPSTGATVGALGAATTGAGRHHASYAATEHGYILGIMLVRTEQVYQQGIHKMWTRSTRYDFYDPALAGLGEQVVTNGELFADGSATDAGTFGYQERWHEYRTMTSDAVSLFRSTSNTPLDAWHLANKYSSAPALNQGFLQDQPPMPRILAAGNNAADAQYLADILIQRTAVRPIPAFGTPALLGRF